MAQVLCLDFDDTIVTNSVADAIWERFSSGGMAELRAKYGAGEITVDEFNAAALDTVAATREEIEAHALEVAVPRAGLQALVDWAQWNDWQVVVTSNGFDLYIAPVMRSLGLDRVPVHAGKARFAYRWRLRYVSPRGIEIVEGFKVAYQEAFQRGGDFVAYVGDGRSDIEAARLAPAVFARDTLWKRLRYEHPRIYHFETFDDVRAVLEREAGRWYESSSSTTAGEGWSNSSRAQ